MTGSASRAGLWHRIFAFIADIFTVSAIVSLVGILVADVSGGRVRAREAIVGRIHCAAAEALPPNFEILIHIKVDRISRCSKELLGVPYDWFLIFRAQPHEQVGPSTSGWITVPLDLTGRITGTLYLDPLVIMLFGVYAFLAEWRFGATLGKRLLGIRVRSLAGEPIDIARSAKRAMIRMTAFAPSAIVTAGAMGSTTFAWLLFEHPAYKMIGGVVVAFWSIAFAANYIVAVTGRTLAWHDRWAGTHAIMQQASRVLPNDRGSSLRPSHVPPWLARGSDNR